MSMKYRKKPVVIEAFKLGLDNMPDWFMDAVSTNVVILHGSSSGHHRVPDTNADIYTLEGWHHASFGDYIIRGVKGEIYPCKPDIFEMTYDAEDTNVLTNGDRIRAMSDEDLAVTILCIRHSDRPWCDESCGTTGAICENCITKWLKEPYKEDD